MKKLSLLFLKHPVIIVIAVFVLIGFQYRVEIFGLEKTADVAAEGKGQTTTAIVPPESAPQAYQPLAPITEPEQKPLVFRPLDPGPETEPAEVITTSDTPVSSVNQDAPTQLTQTEESQAASDEQLAETAEVTSAAAETSPAPTDSVIGPLKTDEGVVTPVQEESQNQVVQTEQNLSGEVATEPSTPVQEVAPEPTAMESDEQSAQVGGPALSNPVANPVEVPVQQAPQTQQAMPEPSAEEQFFNQLMWARSAARRGDVANASQVYQQLIAEYPEQLDLRGEWADLLFRTHQWEQAQQQYEIIINALIQSGQRERAVQMIQIIGSYSAPLADALVPLLSFSEVETAPQGYQ